ncbi:cytochrome-c oxidase, cbb3-type subunit III [Sphingomonas sp. HT-1]|uniref:cytochrome-c oxidase, cbb3-type subunit III n=1 Tax=unclassified Sphingomonas TaxID=196159 RepID=UPI0002E0880B|nr:MULTISPECIES: cytochrome-c oxidase, cbb3-type subunit III [unclassified Sphingomonas]KTF69021.1 cytochrome C oxidase Cbb3 [Sphingomonas sp. WG]
MAENKRIDEKTGTSTVGHEWDGIEELDTPMPRWWLWTFYATILFAIAYCVAYPAWPLLSGATRGMLGWSSRGDLQQELAAERERRAPTMRALAATPIERLADNPRLLAAAVEGGRSVFKVHCAACHGAGAAGSKGYPNLNDDDWLWGGDIATIQQTVVHGIRQPDDDATRMSQMPAFGRDQILKPAEVDDVVSYVRLVSKQEPASASAKRGAALFVNNCAVCHGDNARGNRTFGAPNLTDHIWLYGGDRVALTDSVANAHGGSMPAWGKQLDPVTIKMVAAYVHSLGGGEPNPPAAQVATAPVAAPPR